MSLKLLNSIILPGHIKPGGFDHAAVHDSSGKLYVAHTANDALDVIDCQTDRYLFSIEGLTGVAGALVSEERIQVFTSNRGENTVGVFSPGYEQYLLKVAVGVRPNGLSFDASSGLLLVANVGSPDVPASAALSMVDISQKKVIGEIPTQGRTRWTVFDPVSNAFYVNIADPPQIVVVEAARPDRVARILEIHAAGPHGLDIDPENQRLFCACDEGKLLAIDMASATIVEEARLSGSPDVIFYNRILKHLYVAVGDPGVIDVFDTSSLKQVESVPTEKGTHTIAFDVQRNKVYAFLPQTHQALVFRDELDQLDKPG